MHKKNVLLQSKVDMISKDFDVLQKENDDLSTMNIGFKRQLYSMKNISNSSISNEKLVKENETLKTQVIDLNSTLTKFIKGKENLDKLLGNQCVFNKRGMGYKSQKKKTLLKLLC